jgi:hypothetical protein
MLPHFLTRLEVLAFLSLAAMLFYIVRAVVVGWRDTNGNGQIDEGE